MSSSRPGQIGIALASFANPISATVAARAPLAGVTSSVLNAARGTGALNNLLSPEARRSAGETFGPYFVAGANQIAPGSGTAAAGIAGSGLLGSVPGLGDLADGFNGPQPDAPVATNDQGGAFSGFDAPPPAANESDSSPLILIVGVVAVGFIILLIALRARK